MGLDTKSGVLVVGIGLPACGKSSLFAQISERVHARVFLEPEEDTWPAAVRERARVGHATCIHWFRSARVPGLFEARAIANDGGVALVDSYYDKLCFHYLGKPGMEWLIAPTDPYFENIKETARIDMQHLPDADVLVLVTVGEEDWKRMISLRSRSLDEATQLHHTYATQCYFIEAAEKYAAASGAKLVRFENTFSDLSSATDRLHASLRSYGILN